MLNKFNSFLTKSYKRNISFVLFVYWFVLVLWQNIGETEARSTIDIIVKMVLIIYFVLYYTMHSKTISKSIILVILLLFSLLVTILLENSITISSMISYIFSLLFIFMVYCFGNKFEINQKQFLIFLNSIIFVMLYAAVYSFVFCQNQFLHVFSISGAYGNELSSFFVSSHEYGMYLVYAITSCLICLHFKRSGTRSEKIPYILAIMFFLTNLLLTFSRTSILAAFILLFVYILFSGNSNLKFLCVIIIILALIVFLTSSTISDFVYKIILKENNLAGRGTLTGLAIQYFNEGTILEKLFGHGIADSRTFFETITGHGSIHNGYLQVLVYYGLCVFLSMVLFLISQCYSCIKIIRKDRYMGSILLGILMSAIAMMFTNTSILFHSSIDSYFLTIFAVVIPKYIRNSIENNNFYIK